MTSAGLPPLYPRHTAKVAADLSETDSKRTVQRKHCLYTVSQCPKRAVVWCRPISGRATAWMRAQGFDCRRMTCTWEEVTPFINQQEALIELAQQGKSSLQSPLCGSEGWIKAIRRRS